MPVEGRLIRQGDLLMLDGEESRMKPWTVLLFSNGFYTVPRSGGELQSFAWSPFSEVREVTPSPEDSASPFGGLPAFTLYLFSQNLGFVFAPWGEGALEERESWVAAMSGALQTFTRSLFPRFSLATQPLPHMPTTTTRILGGFLLREDEDGSAVAIPYCELHAHRVNVALFAMYESESCERLERTIALTAATPMIDRERGQTGCFSLDGQHFCARNCQEKHLWLRALRNVKVKLLNDAPDPTMEDLHHWRDAVGERVASIPAEDFEDFEESSCSAGLPTILTGTQPGPEASRQTSRLQKPRCSTDGRADTLQGSTPRQPPQQPKIGSLQAPGPQALPEAAIPPCCSAPEDADCSSGLAAAPGRPATLLGSFRRKPPEQQHHQQILQDKEREQEQHHQQILQDKERIARQPREDDMLIPGKLTSLSTGPGAEMWSLFAAPGAEMRRGARPFNGGGPAAPAFEDPITADALHELSCLSLPVSPIEADLPAWLCDEDILTSSVERAI